MPEQVNRDDVGVGDNVAVVLRAEDGSIKHAEGVKGPDPKEWGDDSERPDPFTSGGEVGVPLGEWSGRELEKMNADEIRDLARDYGIAGRSKGELVGKLAEKGIGVVKGPGEQWETNEEGEYVNR